MCGRACVWYLSCAHRSMSHVLTRAMRSQATRQTVVTTLCTAAASADAQPWPWFHTTSSAINTQHLLFTPWWGCAVRTLALVTSSGVMSRHAVLTMPRCHGCTLPCVASRVRLLGPSLSMCSRSELAVDMASLARMSPFLSVCWISSRQTALPCLAVCKM